MRIITGTAGGIPIAVPKSVTRPTADRVREAVFSILGERAEGARVLDLFAGSGSYGLECLSRGAVSALFVESDRGAAEVIRRNLEKSRLHGGRILTAAAEAFLKGRGRTMGEVFDLIFADPPWVKRAGDTNHAQWLLTNDSLPGLLAPGGLLVLESRAAAGTAAAAPPPPWQTLDERRYGDSLINFLTIAPAPPLHETPPGSAAV